MRKSSVLSEKKENKILPEEKSSSENVEKNAALQFFFTVEGEKALFPPLKRKKCE